MLRLAHLPHALSREHKISFGTAASLWSRVSQSRAYEAAGLKPFQDRIDAALQHFTARSFGDFGRDRHTVGLSPKAEYRQHNHEFVLAKEFTLAHLFHDSDDIAGVN